MATIRDVAQRAGVSTMTVSRVLNNSGYVSVDARVRVEAAVAELGYVPNTLGLSLRFKRTKTLALVVTDITNPFFTSMVRGVEDLASQHGFSTILCNTDESEAKQADYLTILLQKRVDGILLVPARSAADPVHWLQHRGVPVVILDRQAPGAAVDCVRGQSEAAGYELATLLYDLGHRDVAVLTGPASVSTAAERAAGFERAWRERGLTPQPDSILYGSFTVPSGYAMAQQVLNGHWEPTAFITGNNFIAIGAYRALRDAGLRIPDDLSLVTFDNVPDNLVLEPFLTVAAQPAYEMGQVATKLLLERLAGEGAAQPVDIELPNRIIVRRSSGRPRERSISEILTPAIVQPEV
jgi:LacI family transcriptional regulator